MIAFENGMTNYYILLLYRNKFPLTVNRSITILLHLPEHEQRDQEKNFKHIVISKGFSFCKTIQ